MPVALMQNDKCPAVRFGKMAVEDRNATIEAGRLITKDVDIAYIRQIGEKDEVEMNADKWIASMRLDAFGGNGREASIPMEWLERGEKLLENYRKGYADQPEGFPVREWPMLTPAQVANLHSMQTFTVEAISQWNENAMAMWGMGGRELREKARTWLASGDQKAEQLAAQKVEIETLKAQVQKLVETMNAMQNDDEDKPRRGRPPRTE